MKKTTQNDIRAWVGECIFIAMILLTAKNGVYLTDFQYMLLITIMLSGYISGGK